MIKKIILNKQLPAGIFLNFFHLSSIQASNVLLQLLLFPLVIRVTGLAEFGHVMVANSYAALMSIAINYGTNQSGIKDIAINKTNPGALAENFYKVFYTRCSLLIISLLSLPVLMLFGVSDLHYYFFACTLMIAEAINPIFFFIGFEKLFAFNLANLLSKVLAIAFILLLVKGSHDAYLVNFYLGFSNILIYVPLCVYAVSRYRIRFHKPVLSAIILSIKTNFSLFISNTSVQLQQSIFLFALASTQNPLVLGAYALCDKIISSIRLLIIAFSSAIYPGSIRLFHEHPAKWKDHKNNINRIFFLAFLAGAAIFLLMPGFIIKILTGESNQLGESYIRIIAFVPLVMAFNSLNMLELLIRNAYNVISRISLILLAVSAVMSFIFMQSKQLHSFAYYPMVIETTCLIFYTIHLKRNPYILPAQP